jgi:hypothetical protein
MTKTRLVRRAAWWEFAVLGTFHGCASANLASGFLQPIGHPIGSDDADAGVYADYEQGICDRAGV